MSNYVRCTKCVVEQPEEYFCKDRSKPTGLHPHCKLCRSSQSSKYYERNKGTINLKSRLWHERNRDYHNDLNKRNDIKKKNSNPRFWVPYYLAHKEEYTARTAERRARQLRASPVWADTSKIREYYKKGKLLGLEVDHVVPLQNSHVCGLHNEFNLQLLPSALNRAKSNKFVIGG